VASPTIRDLDQQLLAEADAIAALTRGKLQVDSTELIREDRDR
jgi:hypothetical protein